MLNNAATAQFLALSDTTYSRSAQLVNLGDIRQVQQDGILKFCLPDAPGDTLVAEAALIKDTPQSGFSWSGNLISGGNGFAIFRIQNGQRSAFISVNGRQYEIVSLSTDIQALIRKKQDFSLANNCGVQMPTDITFSDQCDYDPDYNTCHALIDILIVVDPEAADEIEQTHGSLYAYLAFADLIVNLAFWNSDVPNKEVSVKWIEMGGFNYSPPDDDLGIFIDTKKFALQGETNNYRNIHNADLVFLLTIERYPGYGGAVNEIGPSNNASYGIVETSSFYSIHAFAHEVGHLFGCRHQWGSDNTGVCAHGHNRVNLFPPPPGETFGSGTMWRTLLATPVSIQNPLILENNIYYSVDNYGAILHYSNPDVSYGGYPTGYTGLKTENNAQQIRNTGCIVANYTASSVLDMDITKTISCETASFFAEPISPAPQNLGQGPYYYTWHWSPDGVFDLNVLTNNQFSVTQSATLAAPPACPVYWVRCTVSSTDGIFITRIIRINLNDYHCDCYVEVPPDDHGSATTSDDTQIRIRPNPASEYIQLFADKFPGTVSFSIFDANGREMQKGIIPGDKNRHFIPVSTYPNGIYFMNLVSEKNTTTIPFIKQ